MTHCIRLDKSAFDWFVQTGFTVNTQLSVVVWVKYGCKNALSKQQKVVKIYLILKEN